MSSFFTVPASQKKRKRIEGADSGATKRPANGKGSRGRDESRKPVKPVKRPTRDESISGSDSDDDDGPREEVEEVDDVDSSESEEETAAERRLRLAERYLENIREEVDEVGFDAEEIDRDLIAERLQEDVAEAKGRIYRNLAHELSFGAASHTPFRNDSSTVTAIDTCSPYAYTVSKDLYLRKWRLQELAANQYPKKARSKSKAKAKKLAPPKSRPEQILCVRGDKRKSKEPAYQGHTDIILCVAASQDGKFVVTGGRDRKIIVWDAATLLPLRVFGQHRDSVTGLAFRRGTNQLYSSSKDRTIKIWSLDELAYVETLFGHQDEVVDIAALAQERCVSVGARDRTARLWKVVEETQLVFRGGGGEKKRHSNRPQVLEGSMDRVAMIDEDMFVTGGDNGNLSLWVTHKKKPIHTYSLAHGLDPQMKLDEASAEVSPDPAVVPPQQPRWITALATIPYSDVILSGSWDGCVRAWKVSEDRKKIEPVGVVGVETVGQSSVARVTDYTDEAMEDMHEVTGEESEKAGKSEKSQALVRGVVNDISVFERGERGKDGVCVVVAYGKEHRFGRWMRKEGRNGAMVFEVPKSKQTNGQDL